MNNKEGIQLMKHVDFFSSWTIIGSHRLIMCLQFRVASPQKNTAVEPVEPVESLFHHSSSVWMWEMFWYPIPIGPWLIGRLPLWVQKPPIKDKSSLFLPMSSPNQVFLIIPSHSWGTLGDLPMVDLFDFSLVKIPVTIDPGTSQIISSPWNVITINGLIMVW